MPFVVPDFSEALKPQGIPTGTYSARIVKAEHKTSKSGQPMIEWTMELFGGTGDQEATNGMTFRSWTLLAGPSVRNLRDLYKVTMGEDMPKAGFDSDDLLGKELRVVLEQRLDDTGEISRFPNLKRYMRADIPF